MIVKIVFYGIGGVVGFFIFMLVVFLISKAAASGFYAAKRYYNKLENKEEVK